ncbi:MAG: rod-binding protein [Caulobacterales bacterium]
MSALSALSTPVGLLQSAAAPPTAAELAKRGDIADTAKSFEASFLSQMLQPMFEGVGTAPPFGGGEAEGMWKSFLADAIAKQVTKSGGIGVAGAVQHEMLRLQGLTDAAK